MKTIVHISDLHFGRIDQKVAETLLEDLKAQQPTLVVISGDLTQRAHRRQFVSARNYIGLIPFPLLVVPGNHDIPLYNLVKRFLRPFHGFQDLIGNDLTPLYSNGGLVVLGINSTNPFMWKGGWITQRQIGEIRSRFHPLDASAFKVLVVHHAFASQKPQRPLHAGDRTVRMLEGIEECGVDLLLAGHFHIASADRGIVYFPTEKRSLLAVQAGTAISTRRRHGPNSYNVIKIEHPRLSVSFRTWDGKRFVSACALSFIKVAGRWLMQ